jgi:hypothetical protein
MFQRLRFAARLLENYPPLDARGRYPTPEKKAPLPIEKPLHPFYYNNGKPAPTLTSYTLGPDGEAQETPTESHGLNIPSGMFHHKFYPNQPILYQRPDGSTHLHYPVDPDFNRDHGTKHQILHSIRTLDTPEESRGAPAVWDTVHVHSDGNVTASNNSYCNVGNTAIQRRDPEQHQRRKENLERMVREFGTHHGVNTQIQYGGPAGRAFISATGHPHSVGDFHQAFSKAWAASKDGRQTVSPPKPPRQHLHHRN